MVPPQDAFRIAPMHRIGRSDGRMAAGGCQPGASGCGSNADFFVSTIWSYRLEPPHRAGALAHLRELPCYRNGSYAFITPDNCLAALRARMLRDGKSMVVSTYGIYRGFVLLEPSMVPEGQETFAGWLDGLEHFGRPVTLAEIAARGAFDFMVTGASAVSLNGVRFGKGHGFFDLEWGMFTDIGIAGERTPVVARADMPMRDSTSPTSPADPTSFRKARCCRTSPTSP